MNLVLDHVIPSFKGSLPWITTEQMIEVDRLMIEDYGIELIQMMENAGRSLAILAKKRFIQSSSANKNIIVLAGTGGNGGGALVCARRLAAWGYNVSISITHQDRLTRIPKHQFDILRKMNIPIVTPDNLDHMTIPDLIIDGIIGYSLNGPPRNEAKAMINWANSTSSPILSLDTPSGIDLTAGTIYTPSIKANATLTLALPKKGLALEKVKKNRGELYLADISVPPLLYNSSSLNLKISNPFDQGDIVKLD